MRSNKDGQIRFGQMRSRPMGIAWRISAQKSVFDAELIGKAMWGKERKIDWTHMTWWMSVKRAKVDVIGRDSVRKYLQTDSSVRFQSGLDDHLCWKWSCTSQTEEYFNFVIQSNAISRNWKFHENSISILSSVSFQWKWLYEHTQT